MLLEKVGELLNLRQLDVVLKVVVAQDHGVLDLLQYVLDHL